MTQGTSSTTVIVPDGRFQAYVSRPATEPAPVVVVIQEIFGVNKDIRATCDELAAQGFIAIAPDLFWRDAPGLDLNALDEAEWKQGFALYGKFDVDRGVRDLAAVVELARQLPGASGRVGITGFCLGGLMTYLVAARVPVDAAVAYYGGRTNEFLDEADAVQGPLMIHLGEDDEFIDRDAQQAIRDALAEKPNVEVHVYPGCMHAFARHSGAHYDAEAAKLANGRTLAFFKANLGPR